MSNTVKDKLILPEDGKVSAELARHGISATTHEVFHLGEYRYTNPNDAIAQAKRLAKANKSLT